MTEETAWRHAATLTHDAPAELKRRRNFALIFPTSRSGQLTGTGTRWRSTSEPAPECSLPSSPAAASTAWWRRTMDRVLSPAPAGTARYGDEGRRALRKKPRFLGPHSMLPPATSTLSLSPKSP